MRTVHDIRVSMRFVIRTRTACVPEGAKYTPLSPEDTLPGTYKFTHRPYRRWTLVLGFESRLPAPLSSSLRLSHRGFQFMLFLAFTREREKKRKTLIRQSIKSRARLTEPYSSQIHTNNKNKRVLCIWLYVYDGVAC